MNAPVGAPVAGRDLRIALVGNPNSGKTALFNALTGGRAKVANYAGVTVERKEGFLTTPAGRRVSVLGEARGAAAPAGFAPAVSSNQLISIVRLAGCFHISHRLTGLLLFNRGLFDY